MSEERDDPRPYRPGVGVMLLNDAGRVFVAQRADTQTAAWQMPQGGVDPGEDPRTAAFREMAEEIGTDKAEVIAETPDWLYYDLPKDLADRLWDGQYRGQMQKWYLARFTGTDADIRLDAHHHPEFTTWSWADPADLPDLIIGFKRPLYEKVLEAFRPYLDNPPDASF